MDCVFSESGLIFESDGPVPFLFEFGVLWTLSVMDILQLTEELKLMI